MRTSQVGGDPVSVELMCRPGLGLQFAWLQMKQPSGVGYHTRLRDAEIHTKARAEEQRGWDFSLPLQTSFPRLEESSSDHQIQRPPKQQVTGWGHFMIPSLAPGASGSYGFSYIAGQGKVPHFATKKLRLRDGW